MANFLLDKASLYETTGIKAKQSRFSKRSKQNHFFEVNKDNMSKQITLN